GVVDGQVLQRRLGLASAGHFEAKFGNPEQPPGERTVDVDSLQPVQPYTPRPSIQDTGVDTQRITVEPVPGEPPRHQPGDHAQHRDSHDGETEATHVARAQRILPTEADRRCQERPAAQQGGQRMQPREVRGRSAGIPGDGGHKPAARAAPSSDGRCRGRAASAVGRPGILASVGGVAVCNWAVANRYRRSSGAEATSTYCIRPYGTTVSCRYITPRVTKRSSSRSA